MSPPLLWPPRGEGEAHASALQARRRPAGRFWKGYGARPTGRTGRRTLGTLGSPALVPRRLERQQGCDSHVGAPAPVTSRPLGDFRVHALREGGVGAAQNPRRGRCVAGPWARPHPLSHAAASGGTSPSLRSREQTGEGCGREARGVSADCNAARPMPGAWGLCSARKSAPLTSPRRGARRPVPLRRRRTDTRSRLWVTLHQQ